LKQDQSKKVLIGTIGAAIIGVTVGKAVSWLFSDSSEPEPATETEETDEMVIKAPSGTVVKVGEEPESNDETRSTDPKQTEPEPEDDGADGSEEDPQDAPEPDGEGDDEEIEDE
jgi:hypothetical protein